MTISVLLLSRYERSGPSSRVRHYNFLPTLQRAGFDVTVAPFLGDDYLSLYFRGARRPFDVLLKAYARRLRQMLTAARYDVIWVEKEALPWIPAELERMILYHRPVVIDFDDAWHLRYATHRSSAVRALLGRKFERAISQAVTVTVGNSFLADWAAHHATRVVELPSCVDVARYPILAPPDGPFTVGWIGTPANEAALTLIAEPLRQLCRTCTARLRVIGGSGRLAIDGVPVEQVSWSEESEVWDLAQCHVGVMPLPDGPWERGKCGYKLVQYMAAARAAVASPVGAATSILVDGETGFLARTTAEWTAAFERLAGDRERTRKLGLAARRRAELNYSLEAAGPRLIEVLTQAARSTPSAHLRPLHH
ncbi:MAG: glycosyltransferase family 4 protein [Xanthobacteraceae bacterium]